MNAAFVAENEASRRELQELIAGLKDQDFGRQIGDHGWTVSALLCHLAFWDGMILQYLRQWQQSGFKSFPIPAEFIDAMNDSTREIFCKMPGKTAAELALRTAEMADSCAQQVGGELEKAIMAGGRERVLRRSIHRREHVEKIKVALGR